MGLPRGCRGRQRGSGCNYNAEAPLPAYSRPLKPPPRHSANKRAGLRRTDQWGGRKASGWWSLVEHLPNGELSERRRFEELRVRDVKLCSLPTHHIQHQCIHNTTRTISDEMSSKAEFKTNAKLTPRNL